VNSRALTRSFALSHSCALALLRSRAPSLPCSFAPSLSGPRKGRGNLRGRHIHRQCKVEVHENMHQCIAHQPHGLHLRRRKGGRKRGEGGGGRRGGRGVEEDEMSRNVTKCHEMSRNVNKNDIDCLSKL